MAVFYHSLTPWWDRAPGIVCSHYFCLKIRKRKQKKKKTTENFGANFFFFLSMKGALLSFKLELQINAENNRFHGKQSRTCGLLAGFRKRHGNLSYNQWAVRSTVSMCPNLKIKTMATGDGQSGLSFVFVYLFMYLLFLTREINISLSLPLPGLGSSFPEDEGLWRFPQCLHSEPVWNIIHFSLNLLLSQDSGLSELKNGFRRV